MRTGPFIHSGADASAWARWTLLAAAPMALAALQRAGLAAAALLSATLAGAWLADALVKRKAAPHAATLVTGVSLAMMLPASAPWWHGVVGGGAAALLAKQAFGGHRRNLFNPSAFARVLLLLILPTSYLAPTWQLDGVSGATPLAKDAEGRVWSTASLLWGEGGATLGQFLPPAVFVGGLLLVALRIADWRIPLIYLATVALCALLLPVGARMAGHAAWLARDPTTHLLAGGTLLAAFFLLTDPVTSPVTRAGRIGFAVIAGVATMAIRFYTPYPDGVAFAVLIGNAAVPSLDAWASRRAG